MKNGERLSLEQIRAFPGASGEVGFKAANRRELYEWTERTLCAQEYASLGRSDKGLVRRYIAKVTGLSRAQVTRLIGKYAESGTIQVRRGSGRRFTSHYSPADIGLLAQVDEAHDTLSLTLFWLLLATNAFNLIDGLDGLCAGLGLIGAAAFFAVGVIGGDAALMFTTLPLAAALAGFLPFNFNPATVFSGDSGALTIGFVLGCSAVLWTAHSNNFASALVPPLVLSVPLLDVSVSVVRRTLKRQPIFSADREHIHHRVLDRTASPRRTVLTLYLMAAPGAIAGVLLITPLVPRHFHLLALPAFCLAIGAGIRWLRYPEFQVAGHWLLRGGWRRTLAAQARVEQLGADLERAASADEYWQTLVDAGREAGWFRIAWRRDGSAREEVLADRMPEWSFTIALGCATQK